MASEFLTTYAPMANSIAQRTGLDPAVVLGIIDTETSGGTRVLSNNIFGISPSGKGGQYVAKYPDVQAGADAFVKLMQQPRYAAVLKAPPETQAQALVAAGYNTVDKSYAKKVGDRAAQFGREVGYQDQPTAGGQAASAATAGNPADALIAELNSKPAGPAAAGPPAAATANPTDALISELNTPRPGDKPAESAGGSPMPSSPVPFTDPTSPMPLAPPDLGAAAPQPDAYGAVLGRIGAAIKEGYNTSPSLLEPAGKDLVNQTWLGRNLLSPQADVIGGLMGAAGHGIGQALYEAGSAVGGPQLGRDVNMLAQVAPAAAMPGFGMRVPTAAESAARASTPQEIIQSRLQAYQDRRPGPNLLQGMEPVAPEVAAKIGERPPAPGEPARYSLDVRPMQREGGAPGEGAPVERVPGAGASVAGDAPKENSTWAGTTKASIERIVRENAEAGGPANLSAAATPQELATMSPQQVKAYRRMAEVNRVISPIEGEDASIKVPGSIPTEAERMGNPVISQKEVMTRMKMPEAFEGEQGRLTQNTKARLRLYDDQTLSDPQIQTLHEDQMLAAQADKARVLAQSGSVDGAKAAARLKAILDDPEVKEQPHIVKVLQPIHDALYDADGNLKTDPRSYMGMHNNLATALDKAKDPLQATSGEKYAFNQLVDAKKAVDEALTEASGGAFRTYLDNQAEFIKQRNAAILLRDFRTKMVNSKTGNIYADRFHKFVTDLAVRRGKPGVDPAMDIPDEVFGRLMDIDDDLKRAARIDLGAPRGSPTNLYFELAKNLGIAGAHSIVSAAGGGPIANIGLQFGAQALQSRLGQRRLNRLVEQALDHPSQTGNALGPPPAP